MTSVLSPTQRALLARRLSGDADQEQGRIRPRTGDRGAAPLSYAQQRLWFLEQLTPGTSDYTVAAGVRLHGDLHVQTLARSLSDVVRRHESLRTRFETDDGTPRQVIDPPAPVSLLVETVANEEEALAIARAEGARPFDLVRGPLYRLRLLRWDEAYALLVTTHHIVTDQWSLGILIDEVQRLYGAYREGAASPLPALAIQYGDYAAWQRGWLQGPVLEAQLAYWREQLRDLQTLALPVDAARPPIASSRGGRARFRLDPALTAQVKTVSQAAGTTVFMTLLASVQAALARWTGQDDIAVGVPIAGRTRVEVEPLIGFFVNTLVLRTRLGGNPRFADLLGRVRDVTVGAYAHQEVPFERLVEELQPERDLNRNPLVQVGVTLQNAPVPSMGFGGLTATPLRHETISAKFDLELEMMVKPTGLDGWFEYRADLFRPATIDRLVDHWQRLLAAALQDPQRRLWTLPLLSDTEHAAVVTAPNQTARAWPETTLAARFEAQVDRTPGALAVVDETQQLTYAEVNARANQLARYLRTHGVGPETVVGVCMPRSAALVIALLGIFKAGGAYVPLDPDYPVARLAHMIDELRPPVLLVGPDDDAVAAAAIAACTQARPALLRADRRAVARASSRNPANRSHPTSLAYVIYTSGSTGRPKGAMIEQRGMMNHLCVKIESLALTAADAVAQTAPLSFDISVWQLFAPLLTGARTVIIPTRDHRDSSRLLQVLEASRITIAELTPSVVRALLDDPSHDTTRLQDLRWLLTTGEAANPATCLRWLQSHGTHCRLLNAYGPTECSDDVAQAELRDGEIDPIAPVTIGRPIANTQLYVLNPSLMPAGIGMVGELCVGGAGVGRGYVGRPSATAAAFVPDPFGEAAGRLYRTGDLARWREDGQLDFLGRQDHQVKIRGHRIETGEIEAILRAHPAVRDVVVAAETRPGGVEKRLVAYTVPRDAEAAAPSELQRHVRARLPEYMVPAVWMSLPALPVTANGKVDRRTLSALAAEIVSESAASSTPPRTAQEATLCAIWEQVLGVPRVGIHDNFFELGGHSLLITQVISRIRKTLQIEVSVESLFVHPTIAQLTELLATLSPESGREGGEAAAPHPLLPRFERDWAPLSHAQQRLWFLDQLTPGTSTYTVTAGVRLQGALQVPVLARSLTEVVRRHESLRTRFALVDGEPRQLIDAPQPVTLDVEMVASEAAAHALARAEAQTPFDLQRGPLCRIRLLGWPEAYALVVTTHHIVTDQWSLGILIDEVQQLYAAYAAGAASPLPALAIQYGDYAHWQRDWLHGPVLDAQLAYWREQLEGLTTLTLPLDHPRPAVADARAARIRFELDVALTVRIKALGQATGTTVFMTLLASFQAVLARWSGQDDMAVGVPIAGRTRMEVEPLIGLFVNTLVLRTRIDGNPSFADLLARVRAATLGAYAHQDLPFERLVEALRPERDLSRNPLFQVACVFQNTPAATLTLDDITVGPFVTETDQTKFDLTLFVEETSSGLHGVLEYRVDLWRAPTMARLVEQWRRLLAGALDDPTRRLSQLPLLSEAERAAVVTAPNQTARLYPAATVHELFDAQVRRTPTAVAVVDGARTLTYADLQARANQLAHHLRARGVGPEVMVGLCLTRSAELVIALLGILKAGGAYVPLDPEHPPARLAYILEDARAALIVTDLRWRSRLPATAPIVALDDAGQFDAEPVTNPLASVAPANLAYIIYTSGSTGTPKGAMLSHQAVANYLAWSAEAYRLHEGAGVPFHSSVAVDLTVTSLLTPLVAGQQIQVVPPDAPAHMLAEVLRASVDLTLVKVTPAHLELLRQSLDPAEMSGRTRVLIVGGEPLPAALVRAWKAQAPATRVINEYGPTETVVGCCVYETDGIATDCAMAVPIGRPIANLRLYVLDRWLTPVGIGIVGELFVGGAGVGRGYVGRPGQTAASFVPDPFGAEGARLYRTGDLARWRDDRELEFLGRRDRQVKIRGFRIETGEIEAVLRAHPAIRDVAVEARTLDGHTEAQLVAYIVIAAGTDAPEPSAWKQYLRARLPEYMVPARWVTLTALPITRGGKLDRRALPEASDGAVTDRTRFTPPGTTTETTLAAIWADVLRVPRVGLHDNFFDLGGHSLLLTRLQHDIARRLHVELSMMQLLTLPTVSAQALAISAGAAPAPEQGEDVRRSLVLQRRGKQVLTGD